MTSLLQTIDQARVAQETAALLKKLRQQIGLAQGRAAITQGKAAVIAGVSRNTFASWERGRTVPMLFQLKRLEAFAKKTATPRVAKAPAKAGAR